MSTVNDEPLMGREEGRKLYEESDKLLRLAEEMQDRCEQYERGLRTLLALGASTTAAFGIIAIYLTIRALPSDLSYLWWAALAYVFAFAAGTYLYSMREMIRSQVGRERRALHRTVDMLRDLEKGIAERNNLSTLERAEFRIRLSRFGIGPGWYE